MLTNLFKCFVFCATCLPVQGQWVPRVVRVNGTAMLDRPPRASMPRRGRFGYAMPSAERPMLRAESTTTAKSQLQIDVEQAKMLFDNFQELLVNGREELGLPPSSYSTKDYTEGTSATTAKFTVNNLNSTTTASKKRFLRLREMAPPELAKRPRTNQTTTARTTSKLSPDKLRELEMNSEVQFTRNAFLAALETSAAGDKLSGRYHSDPNPNRDYESPKRDAAGHRAAARKALQENPFQGTYELSRGKNGSLGQVDKSSREMSAQFIIKSTTPTTTLHTEATTANNLMPKLQAAGPKSANGSSTRSSPTPSSSRLTRIVKYLLQGNQTVTYTAKEVGPTTTASAASQGADDNGRYFSQFYPQLLEMMSLKDNQEVGLLKGSLCAAMDMYHATGKFRFLSVLDQNLMLASDYLRDMPDDHVKELAVMADELFRDNKLADDTRELVDFLNYIYTDKDADHMSLILYNVKNYHNRSSVDVGDQMVRWLILLPLKRISGDEPLLHAFIDVAMTFIERFKKPQELPQDIHRPPPPPGRRDGVALKTTEQALRIEFTPLNLRRARPYASKKRKPTQKRPHTTRSKRPQTTRSKRPQTTRSKEAEEKSSSELYERDTSKQRRFLIVGRKDASQSARRDNKMAAVWRENGMANKMARFRALSREDSLVPGRVASVASPAEADSLRKYLYDCVKRIMYRRN